MAYLNEFPHVDANKLNLDWLLEQYATFDERLQEVQNHFDEVAEAMERSNEEYQQALTNAFNAFKQEVERESYTVERTLETITNNMTEYVGEHMQEWQVNASRLTVPVSDYYGTGVIPNVLANEHDIVILDCFYAYRDNENVLWRYIQKMDVVNVYIDSDNHYHINVVPQIESATFYVHYSII